MRQRLRCLLLTMFALAVLMPQPTAVAQEHIRGVTLSVRAAKQRVVWGEPILLSVTMQASRQRYVPDSLPSNLFYRVVTPDGKTLNGRSYPIFCYFGPPPCVSVGPGQSLFYEADLLHEVSKITDRVGRLEVSVHYSAAPWSETNPRPAEVVTGALRSNRITIDVVPPVGVDAEAHRMLWPPEERNDSTEQGRIPSLVRLCTFRNKERIEQVLERYPHSTYSKYILYYLAEFYSMMPADSVQEKVIQYYRRAIRENPGFVLEEQAQLGIARALFRKTENEAARREAAYLVRHSSSGFVAQEARRLLAEIDNAARQKQPLPRDTD